MNNFMTLDHPAPKTFDADIIDDVDIMNPAYEKSQI